MVRAVTLNGRSLLLTGLLCVIVVYLFTIVAFVTFREDFVDATGTHYCDNLIEVSRVAHVQICVTAAYLNEFFGGMKIFEPMGYAQ